jgi:hypothetical protein
MPLTGHGTAIVFYMAVVVEVSPVMCGSWNGQRGCIPQLFEDGGDWQAGQRRFLNLGCQNPVAFFPGICDIVGSILPSDLPSGLLRSPCSGSLDTAQ